MTATDVRPVPPARDAVTLGYDEASRVPVLLAEKAALMGDADRLECEVARLHELVGELRGAAAALKAENARLTEEVAVPDVSASPRHPDAPGATAGGSVMRQRMTNSPRWHSDTPHPMNGPQNGEPQ